jgi:proteasome lid subunit RPN8/RPN11
VKINRAIIDIIFNQGRNESPNEACGYLLGKDGVVVTALPLTNIDHSPEHFSLDPKEQFSAVRRARAEGLEIIAVYHTHPASPARPSVEDIKLAYDPNIVYVIASLAAETKAVKAFRIIKGQVAEEKLIIKEQV